MISERDSPPQTLRLDPQASARLAQRSVVAGLDRTGLPHLLIKVPDLDKAMGAEVGIEIDRDDDGCVAVAVLLYDIPTQPVSYDMRFYPDEAEDLGFLRSFLEHGRFRLRPCQAGSGGDWVAGPAEAFRLPANVHLRLKHYSLGWSQPEPTPPASRVAAPAPPEAVKESVTVARASDPRDTVIRKLKEQVETLRGQVQDKDKRIIELEDELNELKSRGRSYRLSGERSSWWNPFK